MQPAAKRDEQALVCLSNRKKKKKKRKTLSTRADDGHFIAKWRITVQLPFFGIVSA